MRSNQAKREIELQNKIKLLEAQNSMLEFDRSRYHPILDEQAARWDTHTDITIDLVSYIEIVLMFMNNA